MEIKIKLLSDLCTYSGETYNSVVDTDVAYDEKGIPYIAAKRLRGCIREAALEMKELGLISEESYKEIFGDKGNQTSAFTLSNAYIEDYEDVINALKKCPYEDLKNPQNVLNQYTYTRTQTSVNLETGVAERNTLRTIRVIRRGLIFTAECNWLKEVSNPEILKNAVSLVKHIGMARTRGLGLVEMKLSEESTQKIRHVLFSKDQLYSQNKISYTVRLKSALICKSPQGNQAVTEDYIAGNKILGMIAGRLGPEKYQELIAEENELIVSNGYIMNGEKRCVPASISLQKKKDQMYDENGKMLLKDMLLADTSEITGKQMTPANISYIDSDGTIMDVVTEISYHHQRPSDKSTGRATGKDASSFYQLAAISPDQSFRGYIYANRKQAEQIMDVVESMGEVRMGYGRSSEFGAVDFTLDSAEKAREEHRILKDAILILGADVLLYNEKGMLTTDIAALEKELRRMTGVEDIQLENPYIKFTTIGGYNVTWKCRKPVFHALGKGSTFQIHSNEGFDTGRLQGKFAGERVSEGYGELMVKEIPEISDVRVSKKKAESVEEGEILQFLLQSEFEKRIKKVVRQKFESQSSKYEQDPENMNTAVAKLRILFRTEHSYEKMKEQVEGIEKETKSNLCRELLEVIDPEQTAEKLETEMKRDYKTEFHSEWSKEKLFRITYRAYLAELKYFVKSIQKKEGDKA